MAKEFFERLKDYYTKVGEVLKGNAQSSSIFPNSTDIGQSREKIYAEFIRMHAPSKCNTFFGGFLFDKDGNESKQMDIIVNTDTTPQFNFNNKDLQSKSFSPIDGTLAVVSVKSTLDKKQLLDSLENIASIPKMDSLDGRINPNLKIKNNEDWPLKIIYANDGLEMQTTLNHINQYYYDNPNVSINSRPNVIHVVGKYVLIKADNNLSFTNTVTKEIRIPEMGSYMGITEKVDIQALVFVINEIQLQATASNHITFDYSWIMNKMAELE